MGDYVRPSPEADDAGGPSPDDDALVDGRPRAPGALIEDPEVWLSRATAGPLGVVRRPLAYRERFVPAWLRGYQRAWLTRDVVAGLTLAAVAIPETMGYTSIARTPIVTGLYTVLLPTIAFALLGSSRLLVVGADSATAAILAGGLAGLGVTGLAPFSSKWLAWCSLTALVTGALLAIARLLRLGFLGDFLPTSVLIGFLTGVGIQVLSGQIPDMLGVSKGSGRWLRQQWHTLTSIPDAHGWTVAVAALTLLVVLGLRRWAPRVPGAVLAVVVTIALAAGLDAGAHGVAVVGAVNGGFPSLGLPQGVRWSDVGSVLPIALSCLIMIVAQSAATARSFAAKHGERVDVNKDILGLSAASVSAGLSGTFVVNGSPTKTQVLDEQRGRSQVANLVMSAVVLVILLFATGLLTDMPQATLAAIVFLIGVDLVDVAGMRRVWSERKDEFLVALITTVVVVVVGVEPGIVLAIVLSVVALIRRQYRPAEFVVGTDAEGHPTYRPATPGAQSVPGLIVFRYDAELFYANAPSFVDDVQGLVESAPDPVKLVVLDFTGIPDVDYSAGQALGGLIDFVHARGARFGVAGADPRVVDALTATHVLQRVHPVLVYATVGDAVARFATPAGAPG